MTTRKELEQQAAERMTMQTDKLHPGSDFPALPVNNQADAMGADYGKYL